jgi:hypothetical protein
MVYVFFCHKKWCPNPDIEVQIFIYCSGTVSESAGRVAQPKFYLMLAILLSLLLFLMSAGPSLPVRRGRFPEGSCYEQQDHGCIFQVIAHPPPPAPSAHSDVVQMGLDFCGTHYPVSTSKISSLLFGQKSF